MNWKFWQKNKEEKASRTHAVLGTGLPANASWSDRDYENFVKETYMKNVVSFACIDRIAKAVSTVPWNVYEKKGEERHKVDEHWFKPLLKRANPEESWMMFLYASTAYLLCAGNSFIEKVAPGTGQNSGIPQELWTLRPDRIKIKIDEETGIKSGYTYNYNGQDVDYDIDLITGKSDLLHLKMFHPLNEFWGMSAVEPAARKIDSANAMDEWNKKLLDNTGRPGMLYFFKERLADDQYERLKKLITENIDGPANAGKSLLLEGATDAKPYGFSPSEMDWINSNTENARATCLAWGVPPQLIGLADTSTYANYQEARSSFYEDTVVFYLSLIKNEFNSWLFHKDPTFIDYNLDDVPAMQYKQNMRWDRAQKSDFLQINEKRALVGFEEVEGGDTILVPAAMLPLGEDISDDSESDKSESEIRESLKGQGFSESEIEDMINGDYKDV